MPVPARKLDNLLANVLGFERRLGRHQMYVLRVGERQVVRTMISHGAREVGDDLLSLMARQMGIALRQLKDLLEGGADREDYLRWLRDAGRLAG